jgi:hypothetical protein
MSLFPSDKNMSQEGHFTKMGAIATVICVIIAVSAWLIPAPFENKEPVDEIAETEKMAEPLLLEDDLKVSYVPFEYTVHEHHPQFVKDAQTHLSVVFQDIDGEDFVTLNISPTGKKSSIRAVLSGYTEEFNSSVGVFNVQILNIDYDSKKVVVQISRKS